MIRITRVGDRLTLFRAQLRKLRARGKLSQAELALRCGVKRGAIAHLENGLSAPSFEMLGRLADEFECSIGELCGSR